MQRLTDISDGMFRGVAGSGLMLTGVGVLAAAVEMTIKHQSLLPVTGAVALGIAAGGAGEYLFSGGLKKSFAGAAIGAVAVPVGATAMYFLG